MTNGRLARWGPWLSVMIAFLGVAVPILIFMLSQSAKEFSFGIVSRAVVIGSAASGIEGLEVIYHGAKLDKLNTVSLQFANTGNMPIFKQDFDRDIAIDFHGHGQIVAAQVTSMLPANLGPNLRYEGTQIAISPLLLNAGDSFTVTVYVAGDYTSPSVDVRIAGVSTPRRLEPLMSKEVWRVVKLAIAGLFGLLLYFYHAGLTIRLFGSWSEVSLIPKVDAILMTLTMAILVTTLMNEARELANLTNPAAVVVMMAGAILTSPVFFLARRRRRRLIRATEHLTT